MVNLTREQAYLIIASLSSIVEEYMTNPLPKNATDEDRMIQREAIEAPLEDTLDILAKNLSDEVKYFEFP